MSVEYRTGDLFNQPDLKALCQGVNCKGLMGAGIATVFKAKHPDMYVQYQTRCAFDGFQLGMCMPWFTHDGHVVFNLATQYLPGPHADLNAIYSSLFDAAWIAYSAGIDKIGLPRIGAGIGGLDWKDVNEQINYVASDFPEVDFVVVSLPEV